MSTPMTSVFTDRIRRWPDDPRAPGLTLTQAFVIFTRRRSPRLIALTLLLTVAARLWVGNLDAWDAGLFGFLLLLHPFSEWLIHVTILHWRPRRWFGLTIDSYLSWSHREHHKLPNEEKWWFIPIRSGAVGLLIIAGIGLLLLRDVQLWLTLLVTLALVGLIYEWTHYLCHSSYRPKSRWYRRIWRHHRWHHFKNEHYWMGVSRHFGDWVLGTNPDVHKIETSPTCRDLLAKEGASTLTSGNR
jgi:hypothetical protein